MALQSVSKEASPVASRELNALLGGRVSTGSIGARTWNTCKKGLRIAPRVAGPAIARAGADMLGHYSIDELAAVLRFLEDTRALQQRMTDALLERES